MQKEKSFILIKYCLAVLIAVGVFVCCKQTSFAIMCGKPDCQSRGATNHENIILLLLYYITSK